MNAFSKIFGVLFLLFPVLAYAGQSCVAATVVPADARVVDFDFVANGVGNFYQASLVPGRSYSVEVRQDYDDPNTDLATSIFPNATCAGALDDTNSTDTTGQEPVLPANSFRRSFTVPGNGTAPVVYTIQTQNGGTGGRYVSVSVSDTTLFNTNWSTFSNFLTVWSFQNTTNKPIAATLTAYDNQGVPPSAPKTINFTIPANSGVNKIIAGFAGFDINAGPQHGGFAILTHNGPPGSVLAAAEFDNPTVSPNALVPTKFEGVRQAH